MSQPLSASDRERRLIEAARGALRYFQNDARGLNGANDSIFVSRALLGALAEYPDVPAVSDADRQRPIVAVK